MSEFNEKNLEENDAVSGNGCHDDQNQKILQIESYLEQRENQNIIYKEILNYEELIELNEEMNRFNEAGLELLFNKDGKSKIVLNYDDIDYEFFFEGVSKFEVDMKYVCYNYIRFVTFEKDGENINIFFDGPDISIIAENIKLKFLDTERTKYTYVSVKYKENHEKTFYYISNIENLEIGDFVWVPVRDEEAPAIVENIEEFSYDEAPFPINETRTIIRKSSRYEYEKYYGL